MTFTDWLSETAFKMSEYGVWDGTQSAAYDFWGGFARRTCHGLGLDSAGTPVYEREWDVLVLLDTCRVDVLQEVAEEYHFVPAKVPTFTSLGSTSWEWLHDNFVPAYADEIASTAYVTANAHTKRFGDEFLVDSDAFNLLDEVWRYAWDNEFGGIQPRSVTDRAIRVARDYDPERLIVHYMQPHTPYRSLERFAPEAARKLASDGEKTVWDLLQMNNLDYASVWSAYRDNLRWVLDEVDLLINNVDADRLVISSDHGEAFGEWGLYGHYRHVPIQVLKNVPWVELTAVDSGEYEPTVESRSVEMSDDDVEQRLNALGYK